MKNIIKLSVFLFIFVAIFCSAAFTSAQYYTGLCTPNSSQRCNGNNLYWYDSCGNQQGLIQYCQNGCYNNSCSNNNNYNYNNNYNNCTYHSYQQCVGNNLYWFNSCGVQQDLIQYCQNGCYNNSCSNNNNYNNNYNYSYNNNYNYNNYTTCNYHAYKDCVGSAIYWFDSCATRQDLYQDCSQFGQTCQYGQCVPNYIPAPTPVPAPAPNPYIAHNRIACYGNNLYWYDSLGSASGLYKTCSDSNSCTIDGCASGKCLNTLKCDGSTCATDSADYNQYCASKIVTPANPTPTNLSVFFSAKKDASATQWNKTVEADQNSTVYFMVTVNNNSSAQISAANISVNVPTEISYLGDLKVDNVATAGDIISGVDIGSIGASSSKTITFEGKTQTFTTQGQKPAVVTVNYAGATQSDTATINFNPSKSSSPAAASVSSASSSTGILGFLKKWYLWILVGLVLIFLFVVVFRRLSSNA